MLNKQSKFNSIAEHLNANNYEFIKGIGSGAFGEVVLASKNGVQYAIKCISKKMIGQRPQLERYVRNQHQVMKALEHPNIIKEITTLEGKDYFSMVLEYCNAGNLFQYQSKKPRKIFTLDQTVNLVSDIIRGLSEIHASKFIHRDIKPENILLKQENGQTVLKIADFGFARPIESVVGTHCGTSNFMAPEILAQKPYDTQADVWSLGVLIYFMIFAEYPFVGLNMLKEIENRCAKGFDIRRGTLKKQKLENCTAELQDLFRQIFVIDPKKRMDLNGILNHSLFSATQLEKKYSISTLDSPRLEDDIFRHERSWTNLQRQKAEYLKQVASRLTGNYASYLRIKEHYIYSAYFFLIRTSLFYLKSTLWHLRTRERPLEEHKDWVAYCQSQHGWNSAENIDEMVGILQAQLVHVSQLLKTNPSSRTQVPQEYLDNIDVKDLDFNDFKVPYRACIGHLFKLVHSDDGVSSTMKIRVKAELFCCHLINRVFEPQHFEDNFGANALTKARTFDCLNFMNWTQHQSRESLEYILNRLHKKYLNSK